MTPETLVKDCYLKTSINAPFLLFSYVLPTCILTRKNCRRSIEVETTVLAVSRQELSIHEIPKKFPMRSITDRLEFGAFNAAVVYTVTAKFHPQYDLFDGFVNGRHGSVCFVNVYRIWRTRLQNYPNVASLVHIVPIALKRLSV